LNAATLLGLRLLDLMFVLGEEVDEHIVADNTEGLDVVGERLEGGVHFSSAIGQSFPVMRDVTPAIH
jgi:hypothetical protein